MINLPTICKHESPIPLFVFWACSRGLYRNVSTIWLCWRQGRASPNPSPLCSDHGHSHGASLPSGDLSFSSKDLDRLGQKIRRQYANIHTNWNIDAILRARIAHDASAIITRIDNHRTGHQSAPDHPRHIGKHHTCY